MDFELKKGRGQILLFNNFLFKKNKTNENVVYFVCVEPSCIAKLLTNQDITSIIRVSEEHNHLPPYHRNKND